ncbi:MAG: hypothetical protein LBC48_04120 [Dysgonamonadaceae bacterium]|jgi:hypothetical protein|nr:hypothetical protein [Dysgonamonadaceae bacterium]
MRRIFLSTIGWYTCAFLFVALAQEAKKDTLTLHSSFPEYPLLPDTVMFKGDLISHPIRFPKPDEYLFKDSAMYSFDKHNSGIFENKKRMSKPILPWEITSGLNFNIIPSRWDLPLLGPTITFAPTLSYQLSDKMVLYGGVGFTQYANLSFAQSRIAPGWPVKSNITTQAFGGFAYALHDRITLHGGFQHSLYNQMPSNLIMFAPAYNTMSVGADLDVWNGLGVTIDRVWDIDKSGRMQQYTRYSPYINVDKFLKFLGL